MELRHLRYFIKSAELLHFTRAAAALHVSQPTLSLQIQQLEEELGSRLFERTGRAVRLTAAGELFLGYARKALDQIEAGQQGIQDLNGMIRGSLRIGVTYSFSAELMPRMLVEFIRSYPAIHTHVRIATNDTVEGAVSTGELDLGLVCLPPNHTGIHSRKLFNEEIVVVVFRKHPLARLKALHICDLENVRLALPSPHFRTRQLVDAAFAAAKIRPQIVVESDDIDVLLGLARMGVAATIVTCQAAAHLHSRDISRIRLAGKEMQLVAAFIWPADIRPAAKRFVELASDYVAKRQPLFALQDFSGGGVPTAEISSAGLEFSAQNSLPHELRRRWGANL